MNVQLRVTDDLPWAELSQYFKVWTDKAGAGFVFHHNLPMNSHYHIYLFGIEITKQGIRDRLAKRYNDRKFSVKTTCGGAKKLPITRQLAYQYGTTKELLEPVWCKIPETELIDYKSKAQRHYYFDVSNINENTLITREEKVIVRTDKVWEKLRDNKEMYHNKTVTQIKSAICSQWLNEGKAIPRGCDLQRYAVSLHMLCKYNEQIIPEDALEKFLEQ